MEIDTSEANAAMQAHAKETALDEGGWVENRFRLVEERLARLEEGGNQPLDEQEFDQFSAGLADRNTVAGLRAQLAHHDGRTPVVFEVDGDDEGKFAGTVWVGQTLVEPDDDDPLRVVYDRQVVIRLTREET